MRDGITDRQTDGQTIRLLDDLSDRGKKTERNRLKWSQNAPFASFISKISRESPSDPLFRRKFQPRNPTAVPPIYSTEIGLSTTPPHPAVDLASRSITDNVHFGAILQKIQLSLSEFKRLDLSSRKRPILGQFYF